MKKKKQGKLRGLRKDLRRYSDAYILVIPVVLYYLLFDYKTMYGVIIAFKDFRPGLGIFGSEWVGLRNFADFFQSYYFTRLLKNTLTISLSSIVLGFPAPIIFALLLNEIKNMKFKRCIQTISYLPHFISTVVICSMITMFVSEKGIITQFLALFGVPADASLLTHPEYFVPIYVISGIWQGLGWGAIIYLAAISGIDQELYEAAQIDGAGKWKQMIHVTLPGISNTIIIMLLMRMGRVMSVGFEKIILLYNEGIYETADVISTFVYRKGLLSYQWSYSAAVGLFNSVINFIIVMAFNKISKSENLINKFTESVKKFTETCKDLMDAMGNNTDAINNINTSESKKSGSFFDNIKEKVTNSIGGDSNDNNETTHTNGVRITNVDEIAKTIAEKINGALSVDVPDAQIQLLINGTGGNEWTITKY